VLIPRVCAEETLSHRDAKSGEKSHRRQILAQNAEQRVEVPIFLFASTQSKGLNRVLRKSFLLFVFDKEWNLFYVFLRLKLPTFLMHFSLV
jgi:hypothetical protein